MDVDVNDLTMVYTTREGTEVTALTNASTTIRSGEFVSLVGPSGCGKTTLLNLLAGLLTPTSGDILVDGVPVDQQLRRPGMVFQSPTVLPWRTSLENVLLPAELGTPPAARSDAAALRARARQLLSLVKLSGFEDKYPSELSGGMQQRLSIARALLLDSELMLMDEPFSALDEFTREQMNGDLLDIWHERRFTAVFVTHNIFEATYLSDRVLVMTPRPGRIVADVASTLPRPRTPDMIGSEAFTTDVRTIRTALTEHWAQGSTDPSIETSS